MKKSIKTVITSMVICLMMLPLLVGCGGKNQSASNSTEELGTELVKAAKGAGEKAAKAAKDVKNKKTPKANPITDFEYDFNKDGESLYIKKYKGTSATVVVPAQIEGMPVTWVEGFKENENITRVVIPEGVTTIGGQTFLSCKNLASIQLPDTLETIHAQAFAGCASLKSIELPKNLKELADGWLGADTFKESGLESVVINSLEIIPSYCFSDCKNLKSVMLQENLKEIHKFAFYGCTSLTDINIPAGIKKIGDGAFNSCPLTNMTVSDSIQKIEFSNYRSEFSSSQPPLLVRKRLQDLGYTGNF